MKYWAFISYSHRDKAHGDWLHKSMESYRVPRPLVGTTTKRGESVPARAYPIFRDREELPTAVDLGEVIRNALEQSRYLIVICSPASAKSRWVNEEIIQFKRLGRENRVLAIIVAGEPNAADGKPGFTVEEECFPPALKFKLGPGGTLSTERTEPIAADARAHADGKNNSLLKLLAGVLGVNYDDLKRRDEAARRRRLRIALASVSAIAAMIAALAVAALLQRNEAIAQRELALVEKRRADENAMEATRQRNEAIEQRRTAEFNLAQSHLGRARQLLHDNEPATAVTAAWQALEMARKAGRELESAGWVLRRALDANRMERQWQAAPGDISFLAFDSGGERLLTFSPTSTEARIWSGRDGREIARLVLGVDTRLVTFTAETTEIVSVRSWFREAVSFGEPSFYGVELTWWDAATGEKLRSTTVPNVQFYTMGDLADDPEWIYVQDPADETALHLVRLRDGWAGQTVPFPAQSGWGAGPQPIPGCGIVLLVDPADGVKLYGLGEDASGLGRLAGVSAMEKLRLSHFVSSGDGTAFGALVWGEQVYGAGVWSASNGDRLAWWSPEDKTSLFRPWMAPAGAGGLAGSDNKLIQALAPALGRAPQPAESSELVRYIQGEGPEGAVAVALERFGTATLMNPASAWQTELDKDISAIALSPDGRLAATGNKRGQVTLWRTDAPFDLEDGLPPIHQFASDVEIVPVGAGGVTLLAANPTRLIRWDIGERRTLAEFAGLPRPQNTWLRYLLNPVAQWIAITPALPLFQPVPDDWETIFFDLDTGRLLGRQPARDWQLAGTGRRALASEGTSWRIVGHDGTALVSVLPQSAQPYTGRYATQSAITPDGQQVVEVRGDGFLEIFDAGSGLSRTLYRVFSADANEHYPINYLVLSPSGRWAFFATYNRCWQVEIPFGAAREIFQDGERPNGDLIFPDGDTLLVAKVGSMVKWWTMPDLTPMAQSRSEDSSLLTAHFSTDRRELVLHSPYGRVVSVVATSTGTTLRRFSDVRALSPDATLLAVNGDFGGTAGIRILRLRDGEILAERPVGTVADIAFASDNSRVAFLENGRLFSFPVFMDEADLAARAGKLSANTGPYSPTQMDKD